MELLNGKRTGGVVFTWIRLAALGLILSIAIQVGRCEVEPTESQCRPYIEKALKEQHTVDAEKSDEEWKSLTEHGSQEDNYPTDELTETIEESGTEENEELKEEESSAEQGDAEFDSEAKSNNAEEETEDGDGETEDKVESTEEEEKEGEEKEGEEKGGVEKEEGEEKEEEEKGEGEEEEEGKEKVEGEEVKEDEEQDEAAEETESKEHEKEDEEVSQDETKDENAEETEGEQEEEGEEGEGGEPDKETTVDAEDRSREEESEDDGEKEEKEVDDKDTKEAEESENAEAEGEVKEDEDETKAEESTDEAAEGEGEAEEEKETDEIIQKAMEEMVERQIESTGKGEGDEVETDSKPEEDKKDEGTADEETSEGGGEEGADTEESEGVKSQEEDEEADMTPEEDLTKEVIIPENLRPRDHITQILRLDEDSVASESFLAKSVDSTLKSLKGLYDNAIKPLEMLYKYRDLSNRHFGDPEIFSKPLILFMGPWSGGKSTTINYLLDNEFTEMSLRTGAEPSPAYFNILMYGNEEEILDGTQLAADWTFSGLQKFGQGLLDRLKGYKLPNRLLEKVNIVEIPGILEIRKQVQRLFPFNDACQWFIDRADIIFLVYDPSKLDVGPETEAILDQLKGREYQTRIILNKADQVKPEELMRVQGTLIWNISPLMSSTEPPVMYTASLWSLPYESGAPTRLLLAQERAFLRDLRDAIDKRVENKIASARRFAVRVRNHAKMVDCYLTTYYNHKTFFGNKKKISDEIIENPQKYHIYEGLSTLTNISRYDLPDPDVYRDFFKLNPLYDFQKLSDTCTYFRGCPINTLDVAIAYDLPELVGKYKKAVESSKAQTSQKTNS